ncbi:Panacea domain-containing protein [Tundrisphaera lichenicola]|uniref:Panacea domain-containing protein n=1 Tax=Tundrisphaera lichenicola TaxID=2029860 RepID=UPI003EBF987A
MPESSANSQEIANYFLANVDEEAGDNLSNLKLQKLVYYAQGLFLAMQGDPLFDESIEAWDHGPVVPGLFRTYQYRGARSIEPPERFEPGDYAPEVRELLDAVLEVYGQFSAFKLMRMTRNEPPWRDTPRHQEITRESLREFFTAVVEAGRSGQSIEGEPVWPMASFQHQRRREIMRRAPDPGRIRAAINRKTARGSAPGVGRRGSSFDDVA